jgi:NAD(P)H-dependent flavin oxidoreductase YrpB (nitropropane dioxygenase family)
MAIQTSVTRLLRIDAPIVQAPIGGLSNPRLAAAVANAGGLGMIAISFLCGPARASAWSTRSCQPRRSSGGP